MFYFVEVNLRYQRSMIIVRSFWYVRLFVHDRYFMHYCSRERIGLPGKRISLDHSDAHDAAGRQDFSGELTPCISPPNLTVMILIPVNPLNKSYSVFLSNYTALFSRIWQSYAAVETRNLIKRQGFCVCAECQNIFLVLAIR
jgi:hypothetical protein